MISSDAVYELQNMVEADDPMSTTRICAAFNMPPLAILASLDAAFQFGDVVLASYDYVNYDFRCYNHHILCDIKTNNGESGGSGTPDAKGRIKALVLAILSYQWHVSYEAENS